MNVRTIKNLVTHKSGNNPKNYDDEALSQLSEFLEHSDIADYLRHCLPEEVVQASDVRLLSLEAIQEEMAQGAAPGSFIRPYGYLIIATSIGGNAICFHAPSGKVFWADHVSFSPECISFENRATGEWQYLYEYTAENVQNSLVLLSDNFETFLGNLLSDRLTAQLESLD